MPIDTSTRVVTLLGQPVAHSLSPRIHNAAFRAQGLDYVYVAASVDAADLAAAVAGLRALRYAGANVTIPHKQVVRPLLDAVTERAAAVGAVNTIVAEEAGGRVRLRGDNTDGLGFLQPLRPHASRLRDAEVVVLGAGGAARAVVYALLTSYAPARLTLAARTPSKAEALADAMAPYDAHGALAVCPLEEAGPRVRAACLLVNATPVGMHPDVGATPWPDAAGLGPGQLVYDLVYAPRETRLLREGAARGATPIGGLEMLIGQAAAAYEQWTGRSMPLDAVRAVLDEG